MHMVLRIEEIVSTIHSFLEDEDLAVCARVCDCWFLPAIRSLWIEADYWSELIIGIFGSKALFKQIQIHPDGYMSYQYDFIREPTEAEWNRLFLYASQVQDLYLGHNDQTMDLTPRSISILSNPRHTSGKPLFPRVRSFIWSWGDAQLGIALLTSFPHLTYFAITIHSNLTKLDLDDIWSALKSTRSTLTSLKIYTPDTIQALLEDGYWDSLCSTLRLCTRLEVFRAFTSNPPMTLEVISTLALLETLKDLRCNINGHLGSHSLETAGSESFFQLEHLRLHGKMSGGALRGGWFPPRKLQTCSVDMLEADSFYQLIDNLSSRESLVHLLDCGVKDSIRYVSGLSNLRLLRSLTIVLQRGSIAMSDEQMEKLAVGTPLLENLCLYSTADTSSLNKLTNFTLLSVSHLVTYCQHLTKLELSFDATYVPPFMDMDFPPPTGTSFTLCPRLSNIHSPRSVASWLVHCLFKHSTVLIEIPGSYPRRSIYSLRWDEVGSLISKANQQRLTHIKDE